MNVSVDAASAADAPAADGAPPDAVTVADGGTVHVVPDPGTGAMPSSWPDTEPNDTPEQAVPLGVGGGQIGPYIEEFTGGGHLGGGDEADYFVFRTAPAAAGASTFIAQACWDGALNVDLLDIALYKVVDGQPLIPVISAATNSTACERLPMFNVPLEADTKYLFALTHVAGAGAYQA
jgi:hypothetical protein